VRRAAM